MIADKKVNTVGRENLMFRFRKTKRNNAPLGIVEITFTPSQEAELKSLLQADETLINELEEDWFDEKGRYISKYDTIVQTILIRVKTSDSILFPRDRYTKTVDGAVTYFGVLTVPVAERMENLANLIRKVGMEVNMQKSLTF